MATKRKSQTIDQTDIEEVFPPQQQRGVVHQLPPPVDYDEPEIDYDDVTALNNVLAELGASTDDVKGFITVFKESMTGNTKIEKYMGRYSVTDYAQGNLLDTLQNTYGSGKYHIRVYHPGGRGLAANKWIDIADNPNFQPPQTQTQSAPQAVDLSPILQVMQQGFEKMFTALTQNQPKQKTTLESLQEMALMRDIFAPANSATPVQPVTQIMDAMKLGMEMAAMNAGGDGNNAWAMKAMDMFGKPIIDAVLSAQHAAPVNHAPRPVTPAIAAPGAVQPIITEDENAMSLMMKGYFVVLSKAAQNNKPVEEYANEILDMIPASELPDFDAMLRAPDWQARLATQTKAVNEYPVWFGNLRNLIIEFRDSDIAELTGQNISGSVIGHENDNSATPEKNGDTGSIT
jgi:hypothetical protein